MCGRRLLLPLVATLVLSVATGAAQAAPPVKLVLESHFGKEVNAATKGDVCPVEPSSSCQPGQESSAPGGFTFPAGVAVNNDPASPQHGDVYVADAGNHRVQRLTSSGAFASMFGAEGGAPGQFTFPSAIAVDPATGDVYVLDTPSGTPRVQKFTPEGSFLLMIGKGVNQTTGGNLCTEEEVETSGVKCGASVASAAPGAGAFVEARSLAVGGPEDLLYVGEEHGVQELTAGGVWKGELALDAVSSEPRSIAEGLAVDQSTGALYVDYNIDLDAGRTVRGEMSDVVRRFTPAIEEAGAFHPGEEAGSFVVASRYPNTLFAIHSIALDSSGRLAIFASEEGNKGISNFQESLGLLYDAAAGRLVTEIGGGPGGEGMAFSTSGQLYGAGSPGLTPNAEQANIGHEALVYRPVPVAELVTGAVPCVPGAERETDVTLDCTLNAEVNPFNVAGTEAWFQWGKTGALGVETPKVAVPTGGAPVAMSAPLNGVRPNDTFFYQPAAFDENVRSPERPLTGETLSFTTPVVPPRVVGEPSASFLHASSALLFGELNPEHSSTRYAFQYAPAAQCPALTSCPTVVSTPETLESEAYGRIGATLEATELQPETTYRFRLSAVNAHGEPAVNATGGAAIPEGSFTTAATPQPTAATGAAIGVGTTTATISGTVEPDGRSVTYNFELGIYAGGETRYGIVFSGSVPAGAASVPVAFQLTGLQPGTTYAYRVTVPGGAGAPATFTTQGLPTLLFSPIAPPLLAIPNVAFPAAPLRPSKPASCKRGYKRNRAGKCVKAKRKSKKSSKRGRRSKRRK